MPALMRLLPRSTDRLDKSNYFDLPKSKLCSKCLQFTQVLLLNKQIRMKLKKILSCSQKKCYFQLTGKRMPALPKSILEVNETLQTFMNRKKVALS